MADKLDKKQETPEKENGTLSSDSEDSTLEHGCDICGIKFSDAKTYENHINGKKHQKAVAKAKFLAKHGESDKKTEEESESDDDNDDSGEMHCKVCDKYITGYIPYITHLKGSKHAKNVKKEKLKERMKDMPEVLDKEEKENVSDDDVLQKTFARCDLCQKEFTGPESLHMHLKSSLHKKKIKQSKTVDNLKAKHQGESKSDIEDDAFSSCSVCQKDFSGPVPYQIHLASKLHKKHLEKMKIAEELKEFCSKGENGIAYVCNECKKSFTDPAAFKNHMKKNSHEKQKAKAALSNFLTSYPEIVFTTPFGYQNEGKDGEAEEEFYMVCKVCHIAFSGPENAQDHVKSKKHASLVKEQKLKNLLKEQGKQVHGSSKTKKEDKIPQNLPKPVTNDDSVNNETKHSENLHSADDFELV